MGSNVFGMKNERFLDCLNFMFGSPRPVSASAKRLSGFWTRGVMMVKMIEEIEDRTVGGVYIFESHSESASDGSARGWLPYHNEDFITCLLTRDCSGLARLRSHQTGYPANLSRFNETREIKDSDS
ncbi:hypothetical protein GEV33_011230 [Tenebrio molitor]|uniref:Uncharacterized protein n=1 Tax=Tenebrio molitor TaxID=7067 RepID=A0A8J6HC06_TENMO|nr:hypothetical protein GEV33_011230 [Tenebrio molitor]